MQFFFVLYKKKQQFANKEWNADSFGIATRGRLHLRPRVLIPTKFNRSLKYVPKGKYLKILNAKGMAKNVNRIKKCPKKLNDASVDSLKQSL